MKKVFFFIVFFTPLSMMAQKTPDAVTTAFTQRFPKAEKVKFEKEKNGEYEANFKLNGTEVSANFTEKGDWRETETEIETAQLPQAVVVGIKTNFPKAKIVEASKIETPDKGVRYEAELKTGFKKKDVLFNADGQIEK